jgi:hypothetical protein
VVNAVDVSKGAVCQTSARGEHWRGGKKQFVPYAKLGRKYKNR